MYSESQMKIEIFHWKIRFGPFFKKASVFVRALQSGSFLNLYKLLIYSKKKGINLEHKKDTSSTYVFYIS